MVVANVCRESVEERSGTEVRNRRCFMPAGRIGGNKSCCEVESKEISNVRKILGIADPAHLARSRNENVGLHERKCYEWRNLGKRERELGG